MSATAATRGVTGHDGKLRSADWTVEPISLAMARELVRRWHYAGGGSNTAVATHGLIPRGGLFPVGCAWWIPPTKSAALATYPRDWQAVLALSRLVVSPDAPGNACSFLLARSVRLLAARWQCLVTYADTWRGHTGAIYKASNWTYIGLTKPERVYVLRGRMIARKAGPYTRTHAEMLALGAECLGAFAKHKFVLLREAQQ